MKLKIYVCDITTKKYISKLIKGRQLILNNFQILAIAVSAAVAAPEAEAEAGYYGYLPAVYNSYPNWPGVSTPFSSSTCFGCRGKRSADAEPGYLGYGYGYAPAYGFGYRAYGPGIAGHPTGTSFVARSPQGLRGKREAEAEAEAEAEPYLSYGYGYPATYAAGYGYPAYAGYGYAYPRAYGYAARAYGYAYPSAYGYGW